MTTTTNQTEEFRSEPKFLALHRVPILREAIKACARRAEKLGVEPPRVETTGKTRIREREINGTPIKFMEEEVLVIGQTPKLPGWRLIAVVDHRDGVVDVVPGESCPPDQRDRGAICDHCKRTDNRRIKTMVLRHAERGEVVQVGTTCIGDFLGSHRFDPQAILRLLASVFEALATAGEPLSDEELEYGGGYRQGSRAASPTVALEWTAGLLANHPWVSRSAAYTAHDGRIPTAAHVEDMIWPPRFSGKFAVQEARAYSEMKAQAREEISDEIREEVQAALRWVVTAAEADPDNDYLYNCAALAEAEGVTARRLGYVCSILPSYRRHVQKVEAEAARRSELADKVNGPVGEVGERLLLPVTVVEDPRPMPSDFGPCYLNTFETDDGRLVKWFGSSKLRAKGAQLVLRGTVKRHGEYRDRIETTLSRVELVSDGEPLAADAARALLAGDVERPADDPGMLALGTAARYMKRAKVWRRK